MAKMTTTQIANRSLSTPVYNVYVVENLVDGGRYVSVRKNISARAFWSLLCVGARDPNFDQPIHNSIRKMHDELRYLEDSHHKITRVATYKSKTEAQVVAAKMIEANAEKARAYNATRPSAGASETFIWYSEEEAKQMVRRKTAKKSAKRTKSAKKPAAKVAATDTATQ